MNSIENKVAFITGGSKGIGYGIAEACLKEGMKVAITARSQTSIDAALPGLEKIAPGKVLGLVSDVRNYESQEKAVQAALDTFGQLDVLVANAGVGRFGPVDQMSIEHWDEVIETNLSGVFYSIKASVEALKKTQGYIFTIASLAGTNFFAQGSAYNASKFGLVGFTQAVMLDLRQSGINVSTIMPGSVATHFNGHTPNEKDAWKIQPEDLGQMTVDLLKLDPRTLPSKVEVRPARPPQK